MKLFVISFTGNAIDSDGNSEHRIADLEAVELFAEVLYTYLESFGFPPIFLGGQSHRVDWIMTGSDLSDKAIKDIENNFGTRLEYPRLRELILRLSKISLEDGLGLSMKSLGTFSIFWHSNTFLSITINSSDEYWTDIGFKKLKYLPDERTSLLTKTDWYDLYP